MKNQIVAGIIIGLFGASLGFGFSQATSAYDVREHSVQIKQLAQDFKDERSRTDSRIFELAALVRASIESDKEKQRTLQDFIQLLKVQNELLQRQRP